MCFWPAKDITWWWKPKGWRIESPAINAEEATPFFIYLQLIINGGLAIGTKIYIPTIIAFTFESILFDNTGLDREIIWIKICGNRKSTCRSELTVTAMANSWEPRLSLYFIPHLATHTSAPVFFIVHKFTPLNKSNANQLFRRDQPLLSNLPRWQSQIKANSKVISS